MKAKSDNLIKELAADLKPVQIVRFQIKDVLKVVAGGFLCVFAAVSIMGLRTDISDQVLSTKFIFDSLLLLILGVLSTMAAFTLSVPSLSSKGAYRLPLFVYGLILFAAGYSFLTTSKPFLYLGHGFSCVCEIVTVSIFPAAILFYFVRRAAVLRRNIVGTLVLMSGVSFGLLATQFICVDSTAMHLLIWHLLPAGIVIAFGIWLSKYFLIKI